MRSVMPRLGWRGTVLDLLYTNVADPKLRAQRNGKIAKLGALADDPNHSGYESCAADKTVGGGEF